MITMVNPETGARFEYTGMHLRPGKASLGDVRTGLAKYPGDKVYLDVPYGVWLQEKAGKLIRVETGAELPPPPADLPRGNASHETWIKFAVSQGMARREAASMSRDELRGRFTDPGFDPDEPPASEVLNGDAGDPAERGV